MSDDKISDINEGRSIRNESDLRSLQTGAPYVVEASKKMIDIWFDVYDYALQEAERRGHDEEVARHVADLVLKD